MAGKNKKQTVTVVVGKKKRPERKSQRSNPNSRLKVSVTRAAVARVHKGKSSRNQDARTNASPALKSVFYNFLAPAAAHGFRWPLDGAGALVSQRTGTATLPASINIQPSTTFVGTYTDGAQASQLIYQFRTPLRAAVWLQRTTSAYVYTAYNYTGGALSTTFTTLGSSADSDVDVVYLTNSSVGAPHGSKLYSGSVTGSEFGTSSFLWVGVNDTVNFVFAASSTFVIRPYRYSKPNMSDQEVVPYAEITGTAFTGTKTFTGTSAAGLSPFGYWCFKIVSTTGCSYTLNLTVAAGDVLSHLAIPDGDLHPTWCSRLRMLGSSALFTNTAAKLYQDGEDFATVINAGRPFYEINTANQINATVDAWKGVAADGIYGWLRPGGAKGWEFRDAIVVDSNGIIKETNYYIDDDSCYNVYLLTASSRNSLSYQMTFHWNLEFITEDVWAELNRSPLQASCVLDIEQLALTHPCFTHNPIHIKDLMNFVNGSVAYLRSHSKLIGNMLAGGFPGLAPIITPIADALQS